VALGDVRRFALAQAEAGATATAQGRHSLAENVKQRVLAWDAEAFEEIADKIEEGSLRIEGVDPD
jgi:hypothetical protein